MNIGNMIWRASAIIFGIAVLIGLLNGCATLTPAERARLACGAAAATLTTAERLQEEDPTPERAKRIIYYRTAKETACAHAATFEDQSA